MAFPTQPDPFLPMPDAIGQVDARVLGDAPAIPLGSLFVATSEAPGNAARNATTAQAGFYGTGRAATVRGIATRHAIDIPAGGVGVAAIHGQVGAPGATHFLPGPTRLF